MMEGSSATASSAKSARQIWWTVGIIALTVAVIAAVFLVGFGPYHREISKLHAGMSRVDVVAALGRPYGGIGNGTMAYYQTGSDRLLVVYFSGQSACGWLLLDVPPTGPSQSFSYSKVVDHGDLIGTGGGIRCFGP